MRFFKRLAYSFMSKMESWSTEYMNDLLYERLGSVGPQCRLNGRIHVTGAENVYLGNNVHIGHNAWIRGEGGLIIGDNTHISRNVTIYTVNHDYHGDVLPYDQTLLKKSVKIGANVWVGMNVSIAPGTRIGEGAIIGLGATVSGDVAPLSIISNQKYRTVRFRDKKHYAEKKKKRLFGGRNGKPISTT